MTSIRRDRRLLAGNRVIPLFHGWMPQRSVSAKLFALVVTQDKSNLNSLVANIASMKTKPRINLLPTVR